MRRSTQKQSETLPLQRQSSDNEQLKDFLITTKEAARYLGITPRYLEARRLRGGGPPFVKLGSKAVRYRISDVTKWVEASTRAATR